MFFYIRTSYHGISLTYLVQTMTTSQTMTLIFMKYGEQPEMLKQIWASLLAPEGSLRSAPRSKCKPPRHHIDRVWLHRSPIATSNEQWFPSLSTSTNCRRFQMGFWGGIKLNIRSKSTNMKNQIKTTQPIKKTSNN